MEDYQKKVIEERDQLKSKFDKLVSFLSDKPKMRVVNFKEGWLLFMQSFVMYRYLRILDKRIKNFSK